MTTEEQVLWEYVEQESDEILLSVVENVYKDGFEHTDLAAELVALKVLSAAIVKVLAVATENSGKYDLATAYMEMVPSHVELIKFYTFRAMERSTK